MLSPQSLRSIRRYWTPTAITFFVNGTGFGGWAAQIPQAIARLGVNEGTFGLLLFGMGIGAIVAMVLSGRLIARFGAGNLIRASCAFFLLGYVAVSMADALPLFIVALLLLGGAGGLMDVAMNAYASDVERHMSWRVMASFHGMWSIGGLAGAALVGFMLATLTTAIAAFALPVLLGGLFLLCQHRLKPLHHWSGTSAGSHLAVTRLTLLLGILAAIAFSAEGAVRDWSALYLAQDLGAGIERAGWGFAALSGAMALCRFGGDWLRSRFGEGRVVMLSGVVALAGFLLAVLADGFAPSVAGFGLVGLGLSNISPILISAAGRAGAPGPSIAFVVSLGYAGLLASPPLLGFLAAQTSLAAMFIVVAASCLAISVVWALRPPAAR